MAGHVFYAEGGECLVKLPEVVVKANANVVFKRLLNGHMDMEGYTLCADR